jgi:hypothetical protein
MAEFSSSAARFIETGVMPPPGLDLVGRWAGGPGEGFAIAECDDAAQVDRYLSRWNDLVEMDVTPYEDDVVDARSDPTAIRATPH